MRVEMLGELRVAVIGAPRPVSGRRIGAILSLLSLYANQFVPMDLLINRLWGDDVPATARNALRLNLMQVESLTQQCGCPCRLVLTKDDCSLQLPVDAVDVHVARRSGDEGRVMLQAGRTADATSVLGRAYGMWRNFELSIFRNRSSRWPESKELQEERIVLFEDYMSAELAVGTPPHDALVGELRMLLDREPLRERLHLLLMDALTAAGQFPRALGVYDRAEARLVSEWGIDAGVHLRQARHRAIEAAWGHLHGNWTWSSGSDAVVLAVEYRTTATPFDGMSPLAKWLDRWTAALAAGLVSCDAARLLVVHGSVSLLCLRGADHARCGIGIALRVLDIWSEYMSDVSHRPGARAVVTAGPVYVFGDAHEERSITGHAVDEAVRLLAKVSDGEVAVSGAVKCLTNGDVLFRPASTVVDLRGGVPLSVVQELRVS